MKLTNYTKILSHALLWGIVLIVPSYTMSRGTTQDYSPYVDFSIRAVALIILFYVNYLYLIDKLLFNKKFITYVLVNTVLIAGLLGIQALLSSSFMPPPPPHLPMRGLPLHGADMGKPPHFPLRIFTDYLLIILIVAMSVAMKAMVRWNKDSINLEKMRSTQLEADLKNLRSQLNPHFLFNTLNNIYSLVAIDAHKAQDSIHRLSGLLRYVLYMNDQDFVQVDKELEFTRNYIDLMQLRLQPTTQLSVSIESNAGKDSIAPLLFMTLIENAFKHGADTDSERFISIAIVVEQSKVLFCTVENSLADTDPKDKTEVSGIGLNNLRKRLELLYPGKHTLLTEVRPRSFFASLTIDFINTTDPVNS